MQFDPIEIILYFPYDVLFAFGCVAFVFFSLKCLKLLGDNVLVVERTVLALIEEDGADCSHNAAGKKQDN